MTFEQLDIVIRDVDVAWGIKDEIEREGKADATDWGGNWNADRCSWSSGEGEEGRVGEESGSGEGSWDVDALGEDRKSGGRSVNERKNAMSCE